MICKLWVLKFFLTCLLRFLCNKIMNLTLGNLMLSLAQWISILKLFSINLSAHVRISFNNLCKIIPVKSIYTFKYSLSIIFIFFIGDITNAQAQTDSFLIDESPATIAGYSNRQLRADYTGPVIRVRRSSDNEEQDINFTTQGWIDTLALKTFVGNDDGYVSIWYNQVSGEPDLIQSTNSLQPMIVDKGKIIADNNNKPIIFFQDGDDILKSGTLSSPITLNNYTFYSVLQADPELWDGGETNFSGIYESEVYRGAALRGTQSYINTNAVRFGDEASDVSMDTYSFFALRNSGDRADLWQGNTPLADITVEENSSLNEPTEKSVVAIGGGFIGYGSEFVFYTEALNTDTLKNVYKNVANSWAIGPSVWNEHAILPQKHEYQVVLYDWLETLSVNDVMLESKILSYDNSYTDNELANLWLQVEGLTASSVTRSDPEWYVLDAGNGKGIEATGTIKIPDEPKGNGDYPGNPPRSWQNEPAFLYQLDIPLSNGGQGNPYYHDPVVGRRAMVVAIVDLIMHHDNLHTSTGWFDMVGKAFLGMAETYRFAGGVLSADEKAAFEEGMEYLLDDMIARGPRGVNTNMDMFAVQGAADLWASAINNSVKEKCIQLVKNALFGYPDGELGIKHSVFTASSGYDGGVFDPSGFIMEGDQPEIFYGGESIYHVAGAVAALADSSSGDLPEQWSFLDEVFRRLQDWRTYQYFYDPGVASSGVGGIKEYMLITAGAGFAGRTSYGVPHGQSAEPWKNFMIADRYISKFAHKVKSLPTVTEMETEIDDKLSYITGELANVFVNAPADWNGWSPWTKKIPYQPRNGWYSRIKLLIDSDDPTLKPPVAQKGVYYNKVFGGYPVGDQYWAYKNTDGLREWGFFLEAQPRQGKYGGWYGGKIETFWTETTGVLLVNQHGKGGCDGNIEDSECFSNLDIKAGHHIWGRDESGNGFTTLLLRGRELNRTSNFTTNNTIPSVKVNNIFNDSSQSPGQANSSGEQTGSEIEGAFEVENMFEALSDGLRVTHNLSSDQKDQITELWASLPIYLRHYNPLRTGTDYQEDLEDTSIEFWNGNSWLQLPEDSNGDGVPEMISTNALRLGRDYKLGEGIQFAYVAFEGAHHIRLSKEIYYDPYQSKTGVRTVHIDLHGNPGSIQTLPAEKSLTYTIQTTDPTTETGDSGGGDPGTAENSIKFATYSGTDSIQIDSETGTTLSNASGIETPDAGTDYAADFACDFTQFDVSGFTGSSTTVTMTLPDDFSPVSFWNYGPTPDNQNLHWYEFTYDGTTGAELNGNIVTLHYVDGERGDDDLTVEGSISAKGGAGSYGEDLNGDGIPDAQQANVVTLQDYTGTFTLTFDGQDGSIFNNLSGVAPPSVSEPTYVPDFTYGGFQYTVDGLNSGAYTTITISLPPDSTVKSFWQYGPTPANSESHWYEFLYDGQTGAKIEGDQITLYLADGKRGDSDLEANGQIQVLSVPGRLLFDGNLDGIADIEQSYVASVAAPDGAGIITLISSEGTSILDEGIVTAPVPGDTNYIADFPLEFVDFHVEGVTNGGTHDITLYLPEGTTPPSFWMYGPTPDNTTPHWYEFFYDGYTGAEIQDNVVTLHFIDGKRGDHDLTADGNLVVSGGPGELINTTGSAEPIDQQKNIISFQSYDGSHYMTLVSPYGTEITGVQSTDDPSALGKAPTGLGKATFSSTDEYLSEVEFPYGFVQFSLTGAQENEIVPVSLYLPQDARPESYFQYGSTPDNPAPHWYEFMYNGFTGAQMRSNVVTLNYVEDQLGDGDLATDQLFAAGGPGYLLRDGNGDGIPDSQQDYVMSFRPLNDADYVTISSEEFNTFTNVRTTEVSVFRPEPPSHLEFFYNIFEYNMAFAENGGTSTITLYLPENMSSESFYNYGPTDDNPVPHWYEFIYDGTTGAEINGNIITLHFADGERGDYDLRKDGMLTAAGGPVFMIYDGNRDGVPDREQQHVSSFLAPDGLTFLTLEAPDTTVIETVNLRSIQSTDAFGGFQPLYECIDFSVSGLKEHSEIAVQLILPDSSQASRCYIQVNGQDSGSPVWAEFNYNGETGVAVNGSTISYQIIDGGVGDLDQQANGSVSIATAPLQVGGTGTGNALTSENVYAYPNPFNPDEHNNFIRYSLADPARVTIKVYDAGSQLVRTLVQNEERPAEVELSESWDGKNGAGDTVDNGVYFFIIETSTDERALGKIAVLR